MSLIPPSTSEKGAGGEDGGKDDSESRLVRGGGEDPGNDGLERLRLPLAPDWKDVSEVRERMRYRYHILSWVNAIKRDAREDAPDSDLDAFNYHVTCFDTLNRSRGEWGTGRLRTASVIGIHLNLSRNSWPAISPIIHKFSHPDPRFESEGDHDRHRSRHLRFSYLLALFVAWYSHGDHTLRFLRYGSILFNHQPQ